MKGLSNISKTLATLIFLSALSACATAPSGPYYEVARDPVLAASSGPMVISPKDQTFMFEVEDRTPFGPFSMDHTLDLLYKRGYDEVRRQKDADFSINVSLWAGGRDNPDVRAGNTLGGALAGAAAGAIIGGALGDPGKGAAIGAASGGALGLVAPASTPTVRIDLNIYSFADRSTTQRSATVDLTHVPPPDVRRVIDMEVSRMLHDIPRR